MRRAEPHITSLLDPVAVQVPPHSAQPRSGTISCRSVVLGANQGEQPDGAHRERDGLLDTTHVLERGSYQTVPNSGVIGSDQVALSLPVDFLSNDLFPEVWRPYLSTSIAFH